jgi:hypothetical protein
MPWPVLLLTLGFAAPALAQDRPAPPRAGPEARNTGGQPQMRRTTTEPFQLGTPAPSAPRPSLAPVPNRNIEGPRDQFSTAPSLEPMLLPPERRPGMTFGREHLRDTGTTDRPFDMVVPGARLRIPFESASPAR